VVQPVEGRPERLRHHLRRENLRHPPLDHQHHLSIKEDLHRSSDRPRPGRSRCRRSWSTGCSSCATATGSRPCSATRAAAGCGAPRSWSVTGGRPATDAPAAAGPRS
jgi:hypothetical protein